MSQENKPTGGKVNYYLAYVNFPRREEQIAYRAECEDIIQALQMTFDEGCAFKAIWRSAAARLGNRKPGHDAVYDAEKVVHYGGHMVRVAKQQIEAQRSISDDMLRAIGGSRIKD